MGDKVQEIGRTAFWNCEALTSIILPGSLKSVGEKAFAACGTPYGPAAGILSE